MRRSDAEWPGKSRQSPRGCLEAVFTGKLCGSLVTLPGVVAYLDGGTAILLWQAAAAGFLGFLYAVRSRIRALWDRLRGRKPSKPDTSAADAAKEPNHGR